MGLDSFCGPFSSEFWTNEGIGLCSLQLLIYTPVSLLYFLASVVYCFVYSKSLVLQSFWSRIFLWRLLSVIGLISLNLLGTLLTYALPLIQPVYIPGRISEVTFYGMTSLLWIGIFIHDILLGKSVQYSSRGPLIHLFLSFCYFYACVGVLWSAYYQVNYPWRTFSVSLRLLHLVLVSLHILSKVPIIHCVEHPRLKRARFSRENKRCFSNLSDPLANLSVTEANESIEDRASWISRILFFWMNGVICSGYYGELSQVSALPEIPKRLNVQMLESRLPCCLSTNRLSDSNDLHKVKLWPFLRILINVFGGEFMWFSLFKFILGSLVIVKPIILNRFIVSFSSDRVRFETSLAWGCALIFSTVLEAVLGSNYNYLMATFECKIRVSVTAMVYRRILSVPLGVLHSVGTGTLVNHLTSDSERIANFASSVQEVWTMPLQVVITVFLLYQQLGPSCFVGLGLFCMILLLNHVFATQMEKFSERSMHFRDVRVKLMSEILPRMNAVKLACWEVVMGNRVKQVRAEELRALRGQKMLDAGSTFCWAVCPVLLASLTFATYALLGNELKASVVFTSLALFNMLTVPMNALPWMLNEVIEATVSIRRVVALLSLPVGQFPAQLTTGHLASDHDVYPIFNTSEKSLDAVIDIQNASFYWTDPGNPVLSDISLKVKKGQLVWVIGPVGSGKSALLLAILGELQSVSNHSQSNIVRDYGLGPRYAYVSQTPWICSGTIRDNIVFGLPVDADRLDQVVDACALGPDLASFPHGLDTNVGEAGGSRLSGGQRARIALARAVYQNADVYLLDDPLAALDVHVGEHVRDQCLLGLLADKTRLITTHQHIWFTSKDCLSTGGNILLEMRNGRIWKTTHISDDFPDVTALENSSDSSDVDLLQPERSFDKTQLSTAAAESSNGSEVEDRERLAFGSITSNVYWTYVKSFGYFMALGVLFSLIFMQGTQNAADWWLTRWIPVSSSLAFTVPYLGNVTTIQLGQVAWSNLTHWVNSEPTALVPSETDPPNSPSRSFYLTVYGSIVGVNLLAATFRAILFTLGGLAAATIIHEKALDTVLHACVSYFDRIPQGRLLNRFSADINTVDDSLPFLLNLFLDCVAGFIGVVIIACLSVPLLLSIVLPLNFAFWSIQRVYRGASRDLKRLLSVTRSPVYAHFSNTLSGLAVIRGLRQELRYRQLATNCLGANVRAELASLAATSWLTVRLQLAASGIVAGVVLLSLIGRHFQWTDVPAVGLSVAYAVNIADLLTYAVSEATNSEKSLIAVERCQELTEETPVEMDTVPITITSSPIRSSGLPVFRPLDIFAANTGGLVPLDWPSAGRVEFKNISLTYRRALQSTDEAKFQALKDVSFTIDPGVRVGIVGRTGSGKSSLLRVLLRLVDHLPGPHTNAQIAQEIGFVGASGQVFVDGVDIRAVPLTALRTYILAVPQEPFLFSGCLRDNLDPEGILPDDVLCNVLVKCRLATTSLEATSMLTLDVGEVGRDISAGQRQLICLARILLRQPLPKVICFDEVTASVDTWTEKAIHEVLIREFAGATVLLIAHRLSSIRRLCSRVLLMQSGRVVADGTPEQILGEDRTQRA